MTCYDVEFVFWLVQHFAGLAHKVEVAGAMKAVLAYCILLVQLVRQRIHVGMRRHALMEGCVKDCYLRGRNADSVCQVHKQPIHLLLLMAGRDCCITHKLYCRQAGHHCQAASYVSVTTGCQHERCAPAVVQGRLIWLLKCPACWQGCAMVPGLQPP